MELKEIMTPKKIAVIGSSGFIGRHLCKKLRDQGHEVVVCDLPGVDITIPASLYPLEGVDVVYHLATMSLTSCKKYPALCIMTNIEGTLNVMEAMIEGTLNVMEAMKKFGIKRLIYSSASSVYGTPDKVPVEESDPKDPLTLYGASKLAAENIIKVKINEMNLNNSFDFTAGIFRFTNVYGPGQLNGVIPAFITKSLAHDEISITGDGSQSRDFVYIDDVVNVMALALAEPMYGFTMNLGSGRQTSISELLRLITDITGCHPKVVHTIADGDRKEFIADTTMLSKHFDVGEYFTNIHNGLVKTIEWWKNK